MIKTVTLKYTNMNNNDPGLLLGIECFDQDQNSILKAGVCTDDIDYSYHNVILEDDERIIGFLSGGRNYKQYASHFDFQFIIGKFV